VQTVNGSGCGGRGGGPSHYEQTVRGGLTSSRTAFSMYSRASLFLGVTDCSLTLNPAPPLLARAAAAALSWCTCRPLLTRAACRDSAPPSAAETSDPIS
jgi:hypothetical protein